MLYDFALGIYVHVNVFFSAMGDACDPTSGDGFFAFPAWYKYLGGEEDQFGVCIPTVDFSSGLEPIWLIALALLDILFRVAGLLAVGYIIFGGYVYIRSAGNPEKISAAQDKITNAIIGLVLVFISVAAVTFIGEKLGG